MRVVPCARGKSAGDNFPRYDAKRLPTCVGGLTRDRDQVNRLTNSSAFSATSRQPASIVSECPRPSILTISVTPGLRFSLLYAAFAIAQGTVWSESAEMISIGPRSSFLELTCASDQGFKFADAAWKSGS